MRANAGLSAKNYREVNTVFPIVEKTVLNQDVVKIKVSAPLIAKKALPGQFIIFRVDEYGERVPLTIADYDREGGTITLIFQLVGNSTKKPNLVTEEIIPSNSSPI